ncbi:MAG: cold shock domain-containing protein [Alphaproteobacteria bacterium]|nr:cold shock domain-containing protein [Alphaproteobacteria bacterium]
MLFGTVKWFNAEKGYGFIVPETADKDVFFHVTQLEKIGMKTVDQGVHIGYTTYKDRGRTAAGDLKIFA